MDKTTACNKWCDLIREQVYFPYYVETATDEIYNWLNAIMQNEYLEVAKIWRLLHPDTWAFYDLMGDFNEHREVILLKEARKQLRAALRPQPKGFRKIKPNVAGDTEHSSKKENRNR